MMGYLSGLNRFEAETFDLIPWQSQDYLATVLANHCTQNPDQTFYAAVTLMAASLHPQRMTLAESLQTIPTAEGQPPIRLYGTTINQVAASLSESGFDAGAPNGVFDDVVRQALSDFQAAEDLPVTGIPDQRTLVRLFYTGPAARSATP